MSTDDIRLSDNERNEALQKLGMYFSEGRLTMEEFEERTASASTAITRRDLVPLFSDLPDRASISTPDSSKELESIRNRGDMVRRWDFVFWAIALIGFALTTWVFHIGPSWVFFFIIPIGSAFARQFYKLDATEERALEEMKRREAGEKEKRLKQAMKRIGELER